MGVDVKPSNMARFTSPPSVRGSGHRGARGTPARRHRLSTAAGARFLPRASSHRAAAGRLHRVHHAVYSLVPPSLLTREGHTWPRRSRAVADAVISYRSAAALHELRRSERSKIDVTIPQRSPRKHAGVDIHRSITLAPTDGQRSATSRVRRSRGRCSTSARSSTAATSRGPATRPRSSTRSTSTGCSTRSTATSRASRPSACARCSTSTTSARRRRGAGSRRSSSRSAATPACRCPRSTSGHARRSEPWSIRADFVWREQRVIVQTDGRGTHRTAQAFEHDRREDQRLVAAGWTVIRTTWRQVTAAPARGGQDDLEAVAAVNAPEPGLELGQAGSAAGGGPGPGPAARRRAYGSSASARRRGRSP